MHLIYPGTILTNYSIVQYKLNSINFTLNPKFYITTFFKPTANFTMIHLNRCKNNLLQYSQFHAAHSQFENK